MKAMSAPCWTAIAAPCGSALATCNAPVSEDPGLALRIRRQVGGDTGECALVFRRRHAAEDRDTEGGSSLHRVASFIADPAPARRAGTADMIDAVIGDMVSAIPEMKGRSPAST